jgi:tRNA(Ile)-lysidine synthetase-like protein
VLVRCALAAGRDALDAALAPALVVRAPREGERLPGARRTIARMLLEARVPRSERSRYPVVSAHGEPVALPGIAVAPALRRPSGLVLTLAAT